MKRLVLATAAAALLGLAAPAVADPISVSVQFATFGPGQVDALPGETVEWTNVSERRHTVTADDSSFDSGDLFSGDKFSHTFAAAGTYAYHCTVHDGMIGEVDVSPVILAALPVLPVPAGNRVDFEGRTANPGEPVRIERSTAGSFQTVATATPAADGTWRTSVTAQLSGDYRAASSAGASGTRHLLVLDRTVSIRATRHGVAVSVTPPLPYGRIVLQQDLRERFGWFPTVRTRLDYVSRASFAVKRPARVRAVLVDKDGWTALAMSRVLTLGHVHPTPMATPMPEHMDHMSRR